MKKILSLLTVFVLILTGCDHAPRVEGKEEKVAETTVVKGNEGDYKTIVPQPVSHVRGVTGSSTNASMDINYMEQGLMQISKSYVSPKDYLYMPGQAISAEEATYLLERHYTDAQMQDILLYNPTQQNIGLNPTLEPGANPADSKIYVQSIVEQDYFKFDDAGKPVVDTVAIGFAFDPTYTYMVDGKPVTVEISDQELNEYAASFVSNQMTPFIRSKPGYENVNIVYGFYKASDSELYPGTFISKGYTKSGEQTMTQKETLNHQYIVYPSAKGMEHDSGLNNEVSSLIAEVNTYFPYTTGMYCVGEYKDGKLIELKFQININTYSSIDVQPFVNYIEEQIGNKISEKVKIVVEIKKPTGDAEAIMLIDESGKSTKYIY